MFDHSTTIYHSNTTIQVHTRSRRQKLVIFCSVCCELETICWSNRSSSTQRPSRVVIFASIGSQRRSLTTHSTWPRLRTALSTSLTVTSTGRWRARQEMVSAICKYETSSSSSPPPPPSPPSPPPNNSGNKVELVV